MHTKKVQATLIAAACILTLSGCASTYAAGNNTNPKPVEKQVESNNTASLIGEAKAKEIALSHAGLKEGDVTFITCHLDYDDGRQVYDIEFYKDMTEYDYEIDAYSGDIWSYDFDIEGYAVPQQAPPAQQAQQSAPTQPSAPAQPAAPAQPTPPVQQAAPAQAASGYISLDRAKEIALSHAGVSAANVFYKEAEFDYDDGFAVYQIEFISGTMEYEVDVDAVSGAIREYDVESVFD